MTASLILIIKDNIKFLTFVKLRPHCLVDYIATNSNLGVIRSYVEHRITKNYKYSHVNISRYYY